MFNIVTKENLKIEDLIYEIRGKEVMLIRDVARLYHVETKVLNQTIKRNIKRFPESFYFQLIPEEVEKIYSRSQIVTLNKSGDLRGYNIKYLPYVLTEHGITMLAGILKSDEAIEMSIKIVNTFILMRKYISKELANNSVSNRIIRIEDRVSLLEESFNKLNEKSKVNTIFYKGEIFDAYYLMMKILEEAKKEIIIIDNYAGKELFNILKNIKVEILIITSNIEETDYKKYNQEYKNIKIKKSNEFHDRFIIIDKEKIYHSGASFKELGNKCFAINEMNKDNINNILDKINV